MRWRIEEYFKFKKRQFELEDLRVTSLQSIRNLNLLATLAAGYISIMSFQKDDTVFMMELKECSKRIYDMPKFIFYALGYAIQACLCPILSLVNPTANIACQCSEPPQFHHPLPFLCLLCQIQLALVHHLQKQQFYFQYICYLANHPTAIRFHPQSQ